MALSRPSNPVTTTLEDGTAVTLDHGAVVIAAGMVSPMPAPNSVIHMAVKA